jgi:hypothetical protein
MLRRKGLISICFVFLAVFGSLSAIRPLPTILAEQPPTPASGDDLLAQSEEPNTIAPNLRFDRLSVADGLSFSFTTSIFQDRQGFMWFGTRYGLNQFDGFNFTVHMLGTSGDILFANYIRNIYEDRSGDLWISNLVDLVRKDKETGEFIHYMPDASNPESLWPGQIYSIAEDPARNIWIGTTSGLN